jgi:Ca-activated chloride channel family protein
MLVAVAAIAVTVDDAAAQVFRSSADLVHVGVTVVDKRGELVRTLTADDFEVVEEGRTQTVQFFAAGDASEAAPLHVGLLLDMSGSMEKDITMARSAAIKFLNTLTQAIDITIADFDTEVRVAKYGQADFPRLVERIRQRRPDGWTALYDALGVYLDGADPDDGRKVLVIYTDGGDTRSTLSLGETLDLLRASRVTVYAVGFLEHQSSSTRMAQRMVLQQLAEVTGGLAFFPSRLEDLDSAYEKVRTEIDAQYSLGYVSTDTRQNGEWRKVEVRLKNPDARQMKVRSRRGYFAPYAEEAKRPPR